MQKPRIFLGSSGKQESLLDTLTRGLDEVAEVVPWTTSFNPGVSTLDRLVELTHDVDFAVFIFAQDDWTTKDQADGDQSGQASPRDNVVFEAGLFGGVLGMHRTFILHAKEAKLPTDLLGLTCVRYENALTPAERKAICQKLRKAIEDVGAAAPIEGAWWQFSQTARTEKEPSALSLLTVTRDRTGTLVVAGRSWNADGRLSARYASEMAKATERGVFYYWKGERPLDADAPEMDGTGEISLESADRCTGYYTVHRADVNTRTSGVYWRADPADVAVMGGRDDQKRAALIAERLAQWKSAQNA